MKREFCDICGREIKGIGYAFIWHKKHRLSFGSHIDICSKECLKKFVENNFKLPKKANKRNKTT